MSAEKSFLALLMSISMVACSSSDHSPIADGAPCPALSFNSVELIVVENRTLAPIMEFNAYLLSANFQETRRREAREGSNQIMIGDSASGTFRLVVEAAGYQDWWQNEVVVEQPFESNGCNPTVKITAEMVRE